MISITYKIKFIDSARCMISSLLNHVANLAEGIHKIKSQNCNCVLEYKRSNYNLMNYKLFIVQ